MGHIHFMLILSFLPCSIPMPDYCNRGDMSLFFTAACGTKLCSSGKLVYVALQFRLQVGGLVLRNDILASKFVKQRRNLDESCGSFILISHSAQTTYHGTRCFGIITVTEISCNSLTNSFNRRFMICHCKFVVLFNLFVAHSGIEPLFQE